MELDKIICGDCIKVMRTFPEESVNMVVTSPPYNCGKDYGTYKDSLLQEEYDNFTKEWLAESYRVLKSDGRLVVNVPFSTNNQQNLKKDGLTLWLPGYLESLSKIGFKLREVIFWIKGDELKLGTENDFTGDAGANETSWGSWLSPSAPYCRALGEYIIVASKGDWKLTHAGKSDLTKEEFLKWTKSIWIMPSASSSKHPAVFPEELPHRAIKLFSWIGDIILDPFSGTGTTCVAAMKLNRRFIGIDQNPGYIKKTNERLWEASNPLLPFIKEDP